MMEQCSGPFDRFGFLGLTSVLIIGCSLGAKADFRTPIDARSKMLMRLMSLDDDAVA